VVQTDIAVQRKIIRINYALRHMCFVKIASRGKMDLMSISVCAPRINVGLFSVVACCMIEEGCSLVQATVSIHTPQSIYSLTRTSQLFSHVQFILFQKYATQMNEFVVEFDLL